MRPVPYPFLSADFVEPNERNTVVAAQTGPFARVVNTDSCLNIRASPEADALVNACAADGVLLTINGNISDGWIPVSTPSRVSGWASAEFLEYDESDVAAGIHVVSPDGCAQIRRDPSSGEILECVPDGTVLQLNEYGLDGY